MEWIDLRSDTLTKPTPEMRLAMYSAELGDDCYGEDPTVRALEALAAEMAGKPAALYVTSGTQGNQLAVMVHARRGAEVLCEASAHIVGNESGGIAALTGAQTRTIEAPHGKLTPAHVAPYIAPRKSNCPGAALLALENTHNAAGGVYYTPDEMGALHALAQAHGVPVHVDGARIFNAAVAQGLALETLTRHAESVQICLSKGLCAPVGSVLVGDVEFIDEARRYRRLLGGGMRQAGVIAAAGVVALKHMVERLAEDHENARLLAAAAAETRLQIDLSIVQINIVRLGVGPLGVSVADFVIHLREHGVLANASAPDAVRLVTHHDVTRAQVLQAGEVLRRLAA